MAAPPVEGSSRHLRDARTLGRPPSPRSPRPSLGARVRSWLFCSPVSPRCTTRIPGELFSSLSFESREDPTGYVDDLRRTFRLIRPVLPPQRSHRHVFVSQDLEACSYVFLRRHQVRGPPVPAYDGPLRVLDRQAKTFTLDINGRRDVVTIARVKPACIATISPGAPSTRGSRPKSVTWAQPGPTAPQGGAL
ncbi:unnamed protein product [Ixodes hexagonus]